jgi:hypothetical protein
VTVCRVPKCDAEATKLVEWGHGGGWGVLRQGGPFEDWLCDGCTAVLVNGNGPGARTVKVLNEEDPGPLEAPGLTQLGLLEESTMPPKERA